MTKMPTREERIEAMTKRHREYIDSITDIYMPRIGFVGWLRLMLNKPEYFDAMDNGSFRREDALSVILAHWAGKVDAHKPYPWEWTDETYGIEDIKDVILRCPKHKVQITTPDNIDGDLDEEIVTIEVKSFLHHLNPDSKQR